jgi:hypothetical protein
MQYLLGNNFLKVKHMKAVLTITEAEIEASQRCALPQYSRKTLCPGFSDLIDR